MPSQPMGFIPMVDEDVDNALLKELAGEIAEEIYAEIEEAFPDYEMSPMLHLPPQQRFAKYMLRLVEAYPYDEEARLFELNNLLNPDYIDLIKTGVLPPPLSKPWVLLIHIPKVFRKVQSDLRQVYRVQTQRQMHEEMAPW